MASGKTGSTRRVKRAPATASRKAITKAGSGITTRQKKALEEDFPLLKGDGYVIRRIGNDGEFSYSKVFHPPSASHSMTPFKMPSSLSISQYQKSPHPTPRFICNKLSILPASE